MVRRRRLNARLSALNHSLQYTIATGPLSAISAQSFRERFEETHLERLALYGEGRFPAPGSGALAVRNPAPARARAPAPAPAPARPAFDGHSGNPTGPAPPAYTPPAWYTPLGLFYSCLRKDDPIRNTAASTIKPLNFTFYRNEAEKFDKERFVKVKTDIASAVYVQKGITLEPTTPACLFKRKVIIITDLRTGRVISQTSPVEMKRGPLETFFKPGVKKPKYVANDKQDVHPSYPFAITQLPLPFAEQLGFAPAEEGKVMNVEKDLDMVYYAPYIPASIATGMFEFLRQELPFYRVVYNIKRNGVDTVINTPRFTTVFGVDATSRFTEAGEVVDAKSGDKVTGRYKCTPRPLPQCLEFLKNLTEATTGETFNFCLVNYYGDGNDSISWHSDDERFLGKEPAIASFVLGAKRDFLMKHKPVDAAPAAVDNDAGIPEPNQIKLDMGNGDMLLMKGTTQSCWLHSVPKRAGVAGEAAKKGRINITFRKAVVKEGTENYYHYNVGSGGVFRWNDSERKMMPWTGVKAGSSAENVEASRSTENA